MFPLYPCPAGYHKSGHGFVYGFFYSNSESRKRSAHILTLVHPKSIQVFLVGQGVCVLKLGVGKHGNKPKTNQKHNLPPPSPTNIQRILTVHTNTPTDTHTYTHTHTHTPDTTLSIDKYHIQVNSRLETAFCNQRTPNSTLTPPNTPIPIMCCPGYWFVVLL